MTVQLLFGTSVALGFVAWAVVANLYIRPQLRTRSRIDALRPLLVLHAFRFIRLSFLVPGVISFARSQGARPPFLKSGSVPGGYRSRNPRLGGSFNKSAASTSSAFANLPTILRLA